MKWLTLVLLLLLTFTMLSGATYIKPGNVSGYWTLDGSPYYIQGDITVPHDKYLKIEAGSKIIFEGYYQLNVYGAFGAQGEKGRMIYFYSQKSKAGWSGILFKPAPSMKTKCILSYCKLLYSADYSIPAIPGEIDLKSPDQNPYDDYGAAVELIGMENMEISHCVIKRLSPVAKGRAISLYRSNAVIMGNTISGSVASEGAGIYLKSGSNPYICSNRIERNRSVYGGAIYINKSNPVLMNNLITLNEAVKGGGLMISYHSNPIMINNTIAYNKSNSGGAIYYSESSGSKIYNTIIWNNKAEFGQQVFLEDKRCNPHFVYCDIEGGDSYLHNFEGNGAIGYSGDFYKNLDIEPQFNNCSYHTCSLLSTSPCIDAAWMELPICLPECDICGNNRISGKYLDIGAYEFQHLSSEDESYTEDSRPVQFIGNYPNPANPLTAISFNVLEESKIELTVFNIKGQLVKSLGVDVYPAGKHKVVWYGKDNLSNPVSSGLYFFKLKAGNQVMVKKMVLMK